MPVRCLSDDRLVPDESTRRVRLFSVGSAKDASQLQQQQQQQQQLRFLEPPPSSRRFSCPPRSAASSTVDDDAAGPPHPRLTTISDEHQTSGDQEMSTLLAAVENLIHDTLVRTASIEFGESEISK